jgi:putative glutamine amidotransferase
MAANKRPWIAIVGELLGEKVPKSALALRYAEAVERAGGLPVLLPPLSSPAHLEAALERVDGFLFSGGDDFETESLGLGPTHAAANPVHLARQTFDLRLARAVLAREIPALGICYGMQLLAIAEGARLLQHLPEDRPGSREHGGGVGHEVRLEGGTKLREILGVASVTVISSHHQALGEVGPAWRISARDDEGLIEAVERREHPFAIGVQWHPERGHPERNESPEIHDRVFLALVEAARERAASSSPIAGAAS